MQRQFFIENKTNKTSWCIKTKTWISKILYVLCTTDHQSFQYLKDVLIRQVVYKSNVWKYNMTYPDPGLLMFQNETPCEGPLFVNNELGNGETLLVWRFSNVIGLPVHLGGLHWGAVFSNLVEDWTKNVIFSVFKGLGICMIWPHDPIFDPTLRRSCNSPRYCWDEHTYITSKRFDQKCAF